MEYIKEQRISFTEISCVILYLGQEVYGKVIIVCDESHKSCSIYTQQSTDD